MNRLAFALILAPMTASFGCMESSSASHLKIVCGELVTERDSATQYSVDLLNSQREHFCSALLVDRSHVVTAAHCLDAIRDGGYVYFGTDASQAPHDNSLTRQIKNIVKHEYYDEIYRDENPNDIPPNDIGVATFGGESPVEIFPDLVDRIESAELHAGDELTLTGYGRTTRYGEDSGLLRKAAAALTEIREYTSELYVEGPTNTCNGDSGGPAFVSNGSDFVPVGIATSGDFYCQLNSKFSDLRRYTPWIKAQLIR